jgi:hypothetical protein
MVASTNANVAPVIDPVADNGAWLAAAKRREARIDDGIVWGLTKGERLVPMPAPAGFALLPSSSQDLFFAGSTQFVLTRVGQTAKGSLHEAIAKAFADGDVPDARGSDPAERVYRASIAARMAAIYAKKNVKFEPKADAKATPAQKQDMVNLNLTVEKYRDDPQLGFDVVIAAAKQDEVRTGTATTRVRAAKGEAADLSDLSDDTAEDSAAA